MRELRVSNLGGGVQSTAIYLMMIDGEIEPAEVAIFADVGDEPSAVYEHLEFLRSLDGPEIVTVSSGNLGENLKSGVNTTGGRFVSIPAHLDIDGENSGIGRRQCTSEYKIKPIEREIRRRLGVKPRKRLPKDVSVVQVFGLSFDEPRRVARVNLQFASRSQWHAEFPLFEDYITRPECLAYLEHRIPDRKVPRSACVYCPYRNDTEWVELKTNDPDGFARAVEIDEAIRDETSACVQGMNATQYLHRSRVPLSEVEFNPSAPNPQKVISWSGMDCEGMCGL